MTSQFDPPEYQETSNPKRYTVWGERLTRVIENPGGEWVRFSDYQDLSARLSTLEDCVRKADEMRNALGMFLTDREFGEVEEESMAFDAARARVGELP